MSVRTGKPNEQPMQASKWLDVQALVDGDEMSLLLEALSSPYLFMTGCVCKEGEASVSKATFLEAYGRYIQALKGGLMPDEKEFRPLFSAAMTVTPDVLYAVPVEGQRHILRVSKPAVQMQFHRLGYSTADDKFRAMAFGSNSIYWGLQFTYPQLYQDLSTHEVFHVDESNAFPNTVLFRTLQRWMRQHTIPTPFLVRGQRVNVSMRLGKNCLSWINQHPQLKKLDLAVAT